MTGERQVKPVWPGLTKGAAADMAAQQRRPRVYCWRCDVTLPRGVWEDRGICAACDRIENGE